MQEQDFEASATCNYHSTMLASGNHQPDMDGSVLLYKIITTLGLLITVVWAVNKPDYDSISTAVLTFAAFLSVFFIDQKNKSKKAGGQSQEVGSGGVGIQAGRDANNSRINKRS